MSTLHQPLLLKRAVRRTAFTLTELLVTTAVIALLALGTILVVNQVRDAAQRTKCMGSLRQWYLALAVYATDNRGKLPDLVWNSPQYIWIDQIPAGSADLSIATLVQDSEAVRVTNAAPANAATQVTFSAGMRCPSWRSVWGSVSSKQMVTGSVLWGTLMPGYLYYNKFYESTWAQADKDAFPTGRLDPARLLIGDIAYNYGASPTGLLRRYHANGQNQAYGDGRITWRAYSKAEAAAMVQGSNGCTSVTTGVGALTRFYR